MRALSLGFGLLMVAAGAVAGDGAALVAVAVATLAVLAGLVSRPAATIAVLSTAAALALSDDPAPAITAIAGLAATGYLVLRHARGTDPAVALTAPTVLGALGLATVAALGAALPLSLPWVPLVAPVAVVAVYVLVVVPLIS